MYSYVPVYNSGYSNSELHHRQRDLGPDRPHTGTSAHGVHRILRSAERVGTPSVQRTLVASFRKPTPLDYLWYTDHEMEDPQLN